MNRIEATQYIKAILMAFGPDEAIGMTKETWAKLHEATKALAEQPATPFGIGGGLVAIKTLLSRDPCAHAKVAIEMIDAMLAARPAQQQEPVWKDLFWKLALTLKCLPSTFPDANGHVLSKAQRLMDAESTSPPKVQPRKPSKPLSNLTEDNIPSIPPAQRKPWVGLTDEDIKEAEWLLSAIKEHEAYTLQEQLLVKGVDVFARAIETKLREKNA